MNDHNETFVPGTETHEYPVGEPTITPSPEFLHDIAQLLETEPDDRFAEPDYDSPEGVQDKYIQYEGVT